MVAPQILKSSETALGPGVPSAISDWSVFFLAACLPVAFAARLAGAMVPVASANRPRSVFWNRAWSPWC